MAKYFNIVHMLTHQYRFVSPGRLAISIWPTKCVVCTHQDNIEI